MRLEDDEIELVGEVDPKAVQAVPLDESMLIGGYVRVLESRLASIDGNHASLAVRGVSYVKPKKPLALDLPCDKIALGTRAPAPQQGKAVELRPGLSEPFSVTKGGEVVGTLVTPKAAPPPKTPPEGGAKVPPFTGYLAGVLSGPSEQVFELGREGGQVQLRITGFTEETTGWVRATAVKGERDGQGGGGLGMRGRRPQRVVCADAVPIYLRSGDEVVRAGQFKPKAHITRDPAPDHTTGKPEEAVIELAQGGWLGGLSVGAGDAPGATGPEVRAFVQASLLEGCAPEAPSADH